MTVKRNKVGLLLLSGWMLSTSLFLLSPLQAKEIAGVAVSVKLDQVFSENSIPVSQAGEVYGAAKLAEAAEKYSPARGDPEKAGDVSFIIAGEVRNPGEYRLPSPVNLLTALLTAGGPANEGSMRRIQVYLDGSLLGEFDLYSFLRAGHIADDFIFNGGEQVVVVPRGPLASVSGSVKMPATYELKADEMKLGRLLELAGGFAAGDGAYRVEVIRIDRMRRYLAFSANVKTGAIIPDFVILADDLIHVYRSKNIGSNKVYAQLPSGKTLDFAFTPEKRLSALINELKPLPANAALAYAELLREGRSDKKYEVIGISIAALQAMIESGDRSQDLILYPGDRLMLFARDFIENKPVVGLAVTGQSPMFTDYWPKMTLADLFDAIDIKLPDRCLSATISRRQLNGARLDVVRLVVDIAAARRRSKRHNIELKPFDTLMIQP